MTEKLDFEPFPEWAPDLSVAKVGMIGPVSEGVDDEFYSFKMVLVGAIKDERKVPIVLKTNGEHGNWLHMPTDSDGDGSCDSAADIHIGGIGPPEHTEMPWCSGDAPAKRAVGFGLEMSLEVDHESPSPLSNGCGVN